MQRGLMFAATVCIALCASSAQAVLVYGKAGRNTAAPKGALLNSGWQYQGDYGVFSGVPIAPNYFITAAHIGGTPGSTFSFGGFSYTTTASYDDPGTDLRIFKVDGTFATFAPLYTLGNEKHKQAAIFGRGTQRGQEIRIGKVLKGWQWGPDDNVRSWGTNFVSDVGTFGQTSGNFVQFLFNAGVGANEAVISGGDSGGGVFIKDHGKWKLAGINYSVEGPFSLTGQSGSGFQAALVDEGGLYAGGDGAWTLNPDVPRNIPEAMYATRISTELPWINSVLAGAVAPTTQIIDTGGIGLTPEPTGTVILLGLAGILGLRRRRGLIRIAAMPESQNAETATQGHLPRSGNPPLQQI